MKSTRVEKKHWLAFQLARKRRQSNGVKSTIRPKQINQNPNRSLFGSRNRYDLISGCTSIGITSREAQERSKKQTNEQAIE